jgi:hypothetical protein
MTCDYSRVVYFDLFGHGRPTRGSVPASNPLTCLDGIFGRSRANASTYAASGESSSSQA